MDTTYKNDPTNVKTFETIGQQAKRWQETAYPGRSATGLDSAKWIFQFYCGMLERAGVENNQNLGTRIEDLNRGTWTCGDHASKLEELFQAFGFKNTVFISTRGGYIGPNSDHGAVAVYDSSGDLYLFDPWMHAYENGNFNSSGTSKWNGMTSRDWEDAVKAKGYEDFSDNAGSTWSESIDDMPGVKLTRANLYPKRSSKVQEIAGTWSWFTGETVEIRNDGTFSSEKNKGNWEAAGGSGSLYTLRWVDGGWIDSLTLSSDGKSLGGQNKYGASVTGSKV